MLASRFKFPSLLSPAELNLRGYYKEWCRLTTHGGFYCTWFFLHFCPPMGTIKTMVFHLSTSWVLLGPWFSVLAENSLVSIPVQKYFWYYWDHGLSFKHPMGTIRTMVFYFSQMWLLLRLSFSKKHRDCCYSTHGFNLAGKSTSSQQIFLSNRHQRHPPYFMLKKIKWFAMDF